MAVTPQTRRFLSGAIAAIYGCISLLGPGLHMLSGGDGLHVGSQVVECAEHDHHHSHHHDDCELHEHGEHATTAHTASRSSSSEIASQACDMHAHDCDVCQFLGQTRSQTPAMAAAISRPLAVASWPSITQDHLSAAPLGPQAPRGPPCVRG